MDRAGDRFELEERIASGGMATVWRGRDSLLRRRVAVKRLHAHIAADAEAAARFWREGQAAASLSHPGVVTVYDAGVDDQGPYLVMEYIEGETLADLLKREGRLPAERVVAIAQELAGALHHAHRLGVVHRDVKPGNVLIDPEGEIRLADFGIARTIEETNRLTQTGTVLGTVAYLSPEQAAGEEATPASDVYALGVVLYQMLTGSVPFKASTPVAVALAHRHAEPEPPSRRTEVPPALEAIVMRALAKDPSERFASAAEMAENLARLEALADWGATPVEKLSGETDTTAPLELPTGDETLVIPPAGRPAKARSVRRMPVVAVVLGGLVLVGLAVIMLGEMAFAPPVTSPLTLSAPTDELTSTHPNTAETTVPEASTFPEALTALVDVIDESINTGAITPKVGAELGKIAREAAEKWDDGKPRDAGEKLRELVQKLDESLEKNEVTPVAAEAIRDRAQQAARLLGTDLTDDDDD